MARTRSSAALRREATAAMRRDARELAQTPTPDPYRHQLTDPYVDRPVPENATLADPAASQGGVAPQPNMTTTPGFARIPPGFGRPTPSLAAISRAGIPVPAAWAAILGFALSAVIAMFGVLLIAWISLQNQFDVQDRSFHQGGDAADLLIALIDLMLASVFLVATSAFATGRVVGRIALTAAGWTTILLCGYWWHTERAVPTMVPVSIALGTAIMLFLAYNQRVTRWLGVRPAPQPE